MLLSILLTIPTAATCVLHSECPANHVCSIDPVTTFGSCKGFHKLESLVLCVDSYACHMSLDGTALSPAFRVKLWPSEHVCGSPGTVSSPFPTAEWFCGAGFCDLQLGVGRRLVADEIQNRFQVCGCPDVDMDGTGGACDSPADFFAAVGVVSLQQCLSNAHCVDSFAAQCIKGRCADGMSSGTAAGAVVFECFLNQACSVSSLLVEGLLQSAVQVATVSSKFECGASAALDPDYFEQIGLPCLVDVAQDGLCDISLGVPSVLGTTRLCGCANQDFGGNGVPCDQPEDFTLPMGQVDYLESECGMNSDCDVGSVCSEHRCLADTKGPRFVSSDPAQGSRSYLERHYIDLHLSETSQYLPKERWPLGKDYPPAVLVYQGNDLLEIPCVATKNARTHGSCLLLNDRRTLRVSPTGDNLAMGMWRVQVLAGTLMDTGQLPNDPYLLSFSLRKDGGCPYLGITGFDERARLTSSKVRVFSGVYAAAGTANGKASWKKDGWTVVWSDSAWTIASDQQTIGLHRPSERDRDAQGEHVDAAALISSSIPPYEGDWVYANLSGEDALSSTLRVRCFASSSDLPSSHKSSFNISPNQKGVPTASDFIWTFEFPHVLGFASKVTVASDTSSLTLSTEHIHGDRGFFAASGATIRLDLPEDLTAGTDFQIAWDHGAFVDETFAPSPAGSVMFTTFGVDCLTPFQEMNVSHVTPQDRYVHGSLYEVACDNGTISPTQTASARCVDGQWERPSDASFACGLPCDIRFGKPFAISVVEGSQADEGFFEGSRIRVTCAVGARVTAGSDPAVWTCEDGSWSGDSIVCDYCCGPYSSPDSAYSIVSEEGDCLGASRSIVCSEDSEILSGAQPATVTCGMTGWSTMDLQCKRRCYNLPTATTNAEFVQRDAWTYDVECMQGYVSRDGSKAVLLCEAGVFRLEGNIECVVGCTPLDLGRAYNINAQQHNATVSCSTEAVLLTPAVSSDVVSCQDGLWSASRTRCEIPCQPLEQEFPGMHFSFATEGSRVECAPGYMPVVDVEHPIVSDYVFCVDGLWRAVEDGKPLQSGPRVECHLPCDQLLLSERFSVEGTGRRHGSIRTVSCAPGHNSADSLSTLSTLTCVDGVWKGESPSCGLSCPAEPFVEFDAPPTHGSEVTYSCSPGHHIWGADKSAKTCVDGEWSSGDTICGVLVCRADICFAECSCAQADSCANGVRDGNEEGIDCGGRCADCEDCDVGALDVFDGRNVHVPQLTSLPDGTVVPLQCELLARAVPAIGFIKCHHGILIGDVSFSCTRPTCFDGVHNGREEGVDCGGDCLSSCPRLGDGVWNGDERGPDCHGDCRSCFWSNLIGNPDEGPVDLLLSGEWKTDIQSMSASALQKYLVDAPFSDLVLDQSVSGAVPLSHLSPFGVKCGSVDAAGFCFDGEFAFLASSPGLNPLRECLGRSSWRAFRTSFFSSPTVTLTHISAAFGQNSLPCSSTLKSLGGLLEGSCSRLAYDDRSDFFCSQCRDDIDTILSGTWTGCEQLQDDIRQWLRLLCYTDDDKRCMWSHNSVLNKLQAVESQSTLDFLAAGCGRASLEYFHSSEELYHTLALTTAPRGESGFLLPRKAFLPSPLQDTKPFIEVLRFDPSLASLQGTCWQSMALLLESESLSECHDKCLEAWASLGAGLATLAQTGSFLGPNRLRIALFGDLVLWMGRSGCRRGYSGERCGQGVLETTYATPASVNLPVSVDAACQCPMERLGNGLCDEQCLSVECAYDGGDCFIERHQASLLGWLNQLLPFSECHPLATAGACRGDCRDKVTRFLRDHDCCAATYIELLSVLLRTQASLTGTSGKLLVPRTLGYVEHACAVSLDAACTLGPSTRQHLQITMASDFTALYVGPSQPNQKGVKEESRILAMLLADLHLLPSEVASGSVDLSVDLPSSPALDPTRLQTLKESLNAVELRLYTTTAWAAVSVDDSPPAFKGALGVGQANLPFASCSKLNWTDWWTQPGYSFESALAIHGASRQVSCLPGFEPNAPYVGKLPVSVTCENGAWRLPGPPLACAKPCPPLTLFGEGFAVEDSAESVRVSCAAGFVPQPSSPSQVVRCRNGSWDPVNFGCVEDDGQRVMCGDLSVGDIVYGLNREPRTVAAGSSRLEMDSKVLVNQVVVWVLGCAQGYDSDAVESVTCIDGRAALYPSSDITTVDSLVHGNITTAQRTALQAHALNVVSLHYYNGNLDEASAADLGSLSPCVRVELDDPESIPDGGLSDTIIVVVFFASAFAAVIIATLAIVLYRNRCFKLNRSSS